VTIVAMIVALSGALLEYRRLVQNKSYRDIIMSVCLLASGLLLGILQMLKVKLPSLMGGITTAFEPFSKMVESWFS